MNKQHDELFSVNHFLLMDEALTLVRSGGSTALVAYYLGTIPFMVGLLFFWHDMSSSSFADDHLHWASLLMAVLFCWMKGWQAVYGKILYEVRLGMTPQPTSLRAFMNICLQQAKIQPWGIFLFTLCIPLLFIPFPWVNAFFQNHTMLGAIADSKDLTPKSIKLAAKEKWQNYVIIWILSPWPLFLVFLSCFGLAAAINASIGMTGLSPGLLGDLPWFIIGTLFIVIGVWPASPLGVVVAVNILLLLMALPHLINMLTGVETVMLRSGYFWVANTTSLLTISCGAYLLLDPLLKAAYTLRCFYGMSLRSGTDLLVDLRLTNK